MLRAKEPSTAADDANGLALAVGTSEHPFGSVGRVLVSAPLRDVPVKVMEPPCVGLLLRYRVRSPSGVAAAPRVVRELFYRVAERVLRLRARPAGIFPFGLGRQPVEAPGLSLGWQLRQCFTEGIGLMPRDEFHRAVLVLRQARNRTSVTGFSSGWPPVAPIGKVPAGITFKDMPMEFTTGDLARTSSAGISGVGSGGGAACVAVEGWFIEEGRPVARVVRGHSQMNPVATLV
jgi:hypothetical protein